MDSIIIEIASMQGQTDGPGSVSFFRDLFEVAVRSITLEPGRAPKWTVGSKIREGWQITTLNVRSLLHPKWIISLALSNLRPVAYEMPGLYLP